MISTKLVSIVGLFLVVSARATTPTTTSAATTSTPVPNVGEWGQCGGVSWTGGTICPVGWICADTGSPYFKQCLLGPSAAPTSISSPTSAASSPSSTSKSSSSSSPSTSSSFITSVTSISTTITSAATTSTLVPNVGEWGQCGGVGFTGGTICPVGWICTDTGSPYFKQCLPGPTITFPTTTTSTAQPTQTFSYLISFGDSYSQTGFNISGTKPSLSNQYGNPVYPDGTTSGGANWIGRIISLNSGTVSYNFASGGATTDANIVAPSKSTALSLVDQVAEFTSNLTPPPEYAPWNSNNTLFVIWIGMNDVENAWSNSSWPTLSQKSVDRYFEQAQILYNAGGRYFSFLNIPPIDKTPLNLELSTADQQAIATAVADYNSLLQSGFDAFVTKNSEVNDAYGFYPDSALIDAASSFTEFLQDPAEFGYTDGTCFDSNGVSCLWADDFNPGIQIQKLVGISIAETMGNLQLE